MITVENYINELDAEMKKTEQHIERCNQVLKVKKLNNDTVNLNALNNNLNNSLKRKKILHDEILGMIDYQDKYGSDRKIKDFGLQRFIPDYMKGGGRYIDTTEPSQAQLLGLDDRDFEFSYS